MSKSKLMFLCILSVASFIVIQACGSSNDDPGEQKLVDLVPKDGEISGWDEMQDLKHTFGGPDIVSTLAEASQLGFNGAANLLVDIGFVSLAEEIYSKDGMEVRLDIVELPDVEKARQGYTVLLDYHENASFEDIVLGAGEYKARMDTNLPSYRIIEAVKGKYYYVLEVSPRGDEIIVTETKNFIKAILNKQKL